MAFLRSLEDSPDHPIFELIDNMINAPYSDPFGMMGHHAAIANANHMLGRHPAAALQSMFFGGFPAMPRPNELFAVIENMTGNPADTRSFCSNSMLTMSSDRDGRPQVYQETMSMTSGPGGLTHTQKTVCDPLTGTQKMAIGRHIGERGHIMERAQNIYSGEREESQEFINIEEDDLPSFNHEWQARSHNGMGGPGGRGNYDSYGGHGRSRPEHRQLALPEPASARKHKKRGRRTREM